MQMVKVAHVDEFARTRMRSYRLMGRLVGVIRRDDGSFFAREVGCKHQFADLTTGRREGMRVTCPRHRWVYDLETGACLEGANDAVLRPHRLEIRDGDIYVSLLPSDGEAAGAC